MELNPGQGQENKIAILFKGKKKKNHDFVVTELHGEKKLLQMLCVLFSHGHDLKIPFLFLFFLL